MPQAQHKIELNPDYQWRMITREDYALIEPMVKKAVSAEAYYTLGADATEAENLSYWFGGIENELWVIEEDGQVLGCFYQRCNHFGLASHVANGGYLVDAAARGRGIGRLLGEKSIERAKERGFRAMQYNFVVSTNSVAVSLWKSLGFEVVGVLPQAFHYKRQRYDDAFVMFKVLEA